MSERSCRDCQYRRVCKNPIRQGEWLAEFCDTYQRYCDRDALLEMADEMDERSRWVCVGDAAHAKACARRIREALGVAK